MRKMIIALAIISGTAQAETIITPSGTYQTSRVGSTTYVIQSGRGTGSGSVSPVMTAPATGSNTYVTPSGTYQTSRVGSTTYVIQSGRTR